MIRNLLAGAFVALILGLTSLGIGSGTASAEVNCWVSPRTVG
jgi:hypothetical protein